MTSVLSVSSCLPPHLHTPHLQLLHSTAPSSASSMMIATATTTALPARPAAAALAQPNMMRGASAPVKAQLATHYTHRSKARPVRAMIATAAAAATSATAQATAAHILQDVADVELSKRLQSRLATLGIGANMVKAEVRANSSTEGGAGNGRSFTLTLTGKIAVGLGSLFNILIHSFLRQHAQIVSIERRITFVPAAGDKSKDASAPLERTLDSAPILALKVAHLAKLLVASTHAVVYAGDHLCQGTTTPSSPSSLTMTAPQSTPPSNSSLLTELSTPSAPKTLIKWIRKGLVKHIINENTDGWFNPQASKSVDNMSDDEVSSVASGSSSDDEEGLTSEHLSELYGNKYKEVCSAHCNGAPGNGASYFRDFEVRRPNFFMPSGQQAKIEDAHLTGRTCSYCSAPLRDTMVDWNESLPRALLQRSVAQAAAADLSLVLGSALRVAPTCDMPQLSSPAAPMILISPFATAKDIEALEGGGILIRKEPAIVLQDLETEMKKLRSKPMEARVVRKTKVGAASSSTATAAAAAASSSQATPAIAVPSIARESSGSSAPNSFHRATALTKTWSKNSHPHALKRAHAHLLNFTQRRGAEPNLGLSGLARPGMLRSSTVPTNGVIMRLSASLPPFPSLDADETETPIPAASAPSRAWSEEPSPRVFHSLAAADAVGAGSLIFPPAASFATPSTEALTPPSLPTVSSPVFVSRGSSLSPPQWANFNVSSPNPQRDEDAQMQG